MDTGLKGCAKELGLYSESDGEQYKWKDCNHVEINISFLAAMGMVDRRA